MALRHTTNHVSSLNLAIEFATACHHGQRRKFTQQPYIVHPLRVLALVQSRGLSINHLIASVLHDVVEDTAATLDDIAAHFGPQVCYWVQVLTTPQLPGLPKYERELRYLKKLQQCPPAQSIKLADIIANVEQLHIEAKTPEGFQFASRFLPKKQSSLPFLRQGDPVLYAMAEKEIARQAELLRFQLPTMETPGTNFLKSAQTHD